MSVPTRIFIRCGMMALSDERHRDTSGPVPVGKDVIASVRAFAEDHGFRLAGKIDRDEWRIEPWSKEETAYGVRILEARSCASIARALRRSGSLAADFWANRARSIGRDAEQIRRLIVRTGR